MKHVSVLIDYDNAKRHDERNCTDVSINLSTLLYSVSLCIKLSIPDAEEISCRLYGGWITVSNQQTDRHSWILGQIGNFRGRHNKLRTRLSIATSLIARPESYLVGTYREQKQKMVDAMIAADLIALSMDNSSSLALVSDDDDLVPSTISGSTFRNISQPLFVLRQHKKAGRGLNDHIVSMCNVRYCSY